MKQFCWFVAACLVIGLLGCGGPQLYVKEPDFRTTHALKENQTYSVRSGGMVLSTTRGAFFNALRLQNRAVSKVMGITCTLSPQTFVTMEEDAEYLYYFSERDRARSFTKSGGMHNQPCGLRVSKSDPADVTAVCDTRNVGCVGCGINTLGFVKGQEPRLKVIPMVNIYAPDFIRKTLKFDSFGDDFLALNYMEERGTENGWDAQGKPVAVPPEVTERIYEFDLQASRIVSVQGAQLEIMEARPDRIVYRVIRQLSAQ